MSSMLFYPGTPSVSGSGAGPFRPGSGSVTAPTYSFAASTNSGMYWDTGHGGGLAFANQGVEWMYFDQTNLGIVMRPSGGTGFMLRNIGTNGLYISTGDGGAYAPCSADRFQGGQARVSTPANTGFGNNSAGSGMYGDGTTCGLATNSLSALFIDGNQRTSVLKQQVASKTQAASPYTVLTADSFTQFDNTGATGSVTFTLPAIGTANLGVRVGFFVSAAQTIVVTANAADTIGTKAAGSSYTGAATKGNYLELVACNGGWAITSNTGYT